MRPLVGSISRLTMRSNVVLPQPDGPMSTVISPGGISSESSRTASVPPGNCLVTRSSRITRRLLRRRSSASLPRRYPRPVRTLAANGPNSWIWWSWVGDHLAEIRTALYEHIVLTVVSVGIGLIIAIPLAIIVRRYRRLYAPVLWLTGLMYAIPALALFGILVPITGLTRTTAIIPLVSYTLLILVRNIVTGLDAVSEDVRDAARGMGYTGRAQFVRVEVPLAIPAIFAGIRIATVSTIALITVTAVIGQNSLGQLIL